MQGTMYVKFLQKNTGGFFMSMFYSLEDVRGHEFYQLPKDLIKNKKYSDLSPAAKISYAILKDRHQVSLKNEWIDELGVYFLLSDNELAEILETSVRSASRYKNDLQKHKLIHMERQGLNRRNKIYLLKPESAVIAKKSAEPLVRPDRTKLSSPDRTILSSQDTPFLSTYSNNNLSNNNLSNLEEEEERLSPVYQLAAYYEKNITETGKEAVVLKLAEWLNILPFEVISAELENCALHGAKSWAYVEKALLENRDLKITTIEELKQKQERSKEQRKTKKPFRGSSKQRKENLPEWFDETKRVDEVPAALAAGEEEEKRRALEARLAKYKANN
jgi:hypothetical protein